MKTIGFKNFRRFENLEPLQLSGVNFFVGGNNSGKSTVTKAIMLLHSNLTTKQFASLAFASFESVVTAPKIDVFRFDINDSVHVGTFARALHKPYPEVKEIVFETQLGDYNFIYTITSNLESTSSVADIKCIEVTNLQTNVHYIFNMEERLFSVEYNTSILKKFASQLDYISDRFSIVSYARKQSVRSRSDDSQSLLLLRKKTLLEESLAEAKNPIEIARLNNELSLIEGKLSILSNEIADDVNPFEDDRTFEDNKDTKFVSPFGNYVSAQRPDSLLSILNVQWKRFKTTSTTNEEEVSDRDLSHVLPSEKAFMLMLACDGENLKGVFFRHNIEYIPAHAVSQKVLFSIDDKNDYMGQVIRELASLKLTSGDKDYRFIETWMKKFEIGLGFEIKPIEGEAYAVSVISRDDNDGIPLADLGMGAIQLILLLMHLVIIKNKTAKYQDTLVIIEEPEQNLHPKFQSMLADLFAYVNEKFGFRLVIETHSEYIIRRTQAMIATGEVSFEDNPFKVYYFPENGQPYDMEYQESGLFAKKFGDGFFDEASRQHLTVIKKARELQ